MKSKSIQGKTTSDIELALEVSMKDGFRPTLAIVFMVADGDTTAVCNILTKRNIRVFGSSAHAPFVDGNFDDHNLVILLLDLAAEEFHIELIHNPDETKFLSAEKLGKLGTSIFRKPSFLVVSGGVVTDGDEIVEGIKSGAGKNVLLFGGLASDELKMEHTFVFTNDEQTDNGLIALILNDEKIELSGLAYGGWEPVGDEKTITSSNGNVVYSIENEPALDFIARYAGIKKDSLSNDSAIVIALSSNFQLLLQREGKHSVMRSPMYADGRDGSIVFGGSMVQGSKVRLCLLPSFNIIENTHKEFLEFKKEKPEADAVIMFSCAGRQMSLGLYVGEEINRTKDIWDAPMVGFFCYGEMGRVAGGENEFHNMTCSLALLKER